MMNKNLKNNTWSLAGIGKTALVAGMALLSVGISSSQAQPSTGFNQTGAGPFVYTDTNNWIDGTINGIWDASLTLTASQTVTFGANTTLGSSLQIGYNADSGTSNARNLTFRADGTGPYTLTLGGNITVSTVVNETVTFGSTTGNQVLNVDLGGVTRTFTASSRTLTFQNVISNGGVVVVGGAVNFNSANTYTGTTNVNIGTLALNGATGSSANSDFTVKSSSNATSSTLQFNSNTNGNTGTTRAKSVVLNGRGGALGATLTITGNSTANSNDTITNSLTAEEGYIIVGVSANGSRNARLTAASFIRDAGSTVLFRGLNLGVNTIASQTAGSANIVFGTAPTLVGTGSAGQTTIGIIKGAYGDITSGGNGAGGGLVTYDSTNGVRLLNTSTEYAAAISNGQTTLDNVLYARTSGGASQNINLTSSTTTIGSLSFKITGAGTNSGVTISGDAGTTLKIDSGVIFASQQVTTAVASDAMTISVPILDLNGTEGVISVFTNGISNSNTPAPLFISSEITNDGGNGVTFGGTGQTILNGSANNSYTGVTTLNSGVLRLDKTGAATANTIHTDLIMNAGTLLKNSNSIADTASVTIHGGSFVMDTSTSSGNNGSSETILNLTMTGGRVQGSGGSNSALTVNGDMTLSGGLVQLNTGGDVIVGGLTTLNGGVLNARHSSSTTLFNGLTTLNTLAISNVDSGIYTPIVLTSNATNKGALLTMNGDLTFTGNGTNTNSVFIDSSDIALANQGVIALEGNRTFNIGNGAAANDLTIVPALVNGVSTGGLIKTGLGTLALGGANTYTGATVVNSGTLLVNGSLSSAVTVSSGASLGGSGTFNGSVTFDSGSTHSPGNSPGLPNYEAGLTYNTGSDFNFELIADTTSGRGTNFDGVNVNGGLLTIQTGVEFNLTFNGSGSTVDFTDAFWDSNQSWLVFDNANSPSLQLGIFTLGTISTDSNAVAFSSTGGAFSFSTSGNDIYLNYTAVPEPSTYALFGLGLGALWFLRRQNKTKRS